MNRNTHQSRTGSGFSLTELLVVIAIIVVLSILALPAFNLITGKTSVEGATNQLAALLGRARAEAIGLQLPTGVLFYRDPASQKDMAVLVQQTRSKPIDTAAPYSNAEIWLDLTTTPDGISIPPGITAQVITQGSLAPHDRYTGYNTPTTGGGIPIGGVILFDGGGRLSQYFYGFRCSTGDAASGPETPLGNLLERQDDLVFPVVAAVGSRYFCSGLGFAMVDRDAFVNGGNGNPEDARATGGAAVTTERTEEDWLDKNATPVLINRYNGTLIKGQ